MKYLIIIVSILLFSNPVIGNKQKRETLYVLGEYPDWKWVEFGNIKSQHEYQGQVKDGKPNGLGILISTSGWKYFGSWKNGEIWNGTEYDKNGDIIKKIMHGRNIKIR